jgi:RNA polymerase sigma factor (sigma-70 family)
MEAHVLPRTGRLFLPRSPKVLAAFSDDRLVEQVRRGNDTAFEAVYDRHHRGILSFCRHMLGSPDEAEDAVQQTFISAYDALHADRRDMRLKPWLYTIARNRCLSILRARREQPAEFDVMDTAGLSDEVQQRSDLRELLQDLRELPVDQRAALVLSELGDMSHAEVGAVVGCEVAKVKSLVFQARSSLIETRRAREIPCQEIREQLATGTGGVLRRGPLRRHIRACEGCAEFRDDVARQRRALAAILPVLPTLGLKKSALAAIGFGGGGGSGGAVLGGGAGAAALASSGAAVKLAVAVVAAGVVAGGGLVLNHQSPAPPAEAAGDPGGGGQAWPAPPAGIGPGAAAKVQARSSARAASRVAAKPPARPGGGSVTRVSASPAPGARPGVKRRGGGRHGGRHGGSTGRQPAISHTNGQSGGGQQHGGGGGGGRHQPGAPQPGPVATASPPVTPAPPAASGGGDTHGGYGGRGHPGGVGHHSGGVGHHSGGDSALPGGDGQHPSGGGGDGQGNRDGGDGGGHGSGH